MAKEQKATTQTGDGDTLGEFLIADLIGFRRVCSPEFVKASFFATPIDPDDGSANEPFDPLCLVMAADVIKDLIAELPRVLKEMKALASSESTATHGDAASDPSA